MSIYFQLLCTYLVIYLFTNGNFIFWAIFFHWHKKIINVWNDFEEYVHYLNACVLNAMNIFVYSTARDSLKILLFYSVVYSKSLLFTFACVLASFFSTVVISVGILENLRFVRQSLHQKSRLEIEFFDLKAFSMYL